MGFHVWFGMAEAASSGSETKNAPLNKDAKTVMALGGRLSGGFGLLRRGIAPLAFFA